MPDLEGLIDIGQIKKSDLMALANMYSYIIE
jgi:hypothetical protein